MSLFKLLVRSCGSLVVLAMTIGLLNGFVTSIMIAIIRHGLQYSPPSRGLVLAFVSICLALPVIRISCNALLLRLAHKATHCTLLELSCSILNASLFQVERIGSARLMAALTDDVGQVSAGLLAFFGLALNVATVAGCLVFLGLVSFAGLLSVIVVAVILVASYGFISTTAAMNAMRRGKRARNDLFTYFRGVVFGSKELKLHATRRRDFVGLGFEPATRRYERHDMAANIIYFGASSWSEFLLFAVLGTVVFYLPSAKILSISSAGAFALVLLYIMAPVATIMSVFPRIGQARVTLEDLYGVGLTLSKAKELSQPQIELSRAWTSLELRDLTMSYGDAAGPLRPFTLGPLNITFRRGEIVFVMGGNGSGKTTLGKLIAGLYSPSSGAVRLDDLIISERERESYRQLFAAVFHDFFLFETLHGIDCAGRKAEIEEYLERFKLAGQVEIRDGNLSTTSLSQGQRKRLALLVSYLEDRPIYLFDEWASDQEPLFRDLFYRVLLPELKQRGKTVFVITHDDRYETTADRIVRLVDGTIGYDSHAQWAAIREKVSPASR